MHIFRPVAGLRRDRRRSPPLLPAVPRSRLWPGLLSACPPSPAPWLTRPAPRPGRAGPAT